MQKLQSGPMDAEQLLAYRRSRLEACLMLYDQCGEGGMERSFIKRSGA